MQELRLRYLLDVAARRPALLLGCTLVAGAVAAGAGAMQPAEYVSTSILRVDERPKQLAAWDPIQIPRGPHAVRVAAAVESADFLSSAAPDDVDAAALRERFSVGERDAGYGLLELRLHGPAPEGLAATLDALTAVAADWARESAASAAPLAAMAAVEQAQEIRYSNATAALGQELGLDPRALTALARGERQLALLLLEDVLGPGDAADREATMARAVRVAGLEAEQAAARAAWQASARRLAVAEAEVRAAVAAVRVVRDAAAPVRSRSGSPVAWGLAGALTGLLVAFALALLVEPLRGDTPRNA